MKKLIIGAAAVLFMTVTVIAQDKTKSCSKSNKACCKQPSKTASLRTVKPAKPAQPAQPAKPAARK